MLGAIAGDIIGSVYEFKKPPRRNFKLFTKKSHFTDDTVLTVAMADAILNKKNWIDTIHEYFAEYEKCGYGGFFKKWCKEKRRDAYNSFGNGSAMRVSPVGWLYPTLPRVLSAAKKSAEVTHNHPEGIKGAQAIAASIFLARTTKSKEIIRNYIQSNFYCLNIDLAQIKKDIEGFPNKGIACSCQFSVPVAIKCFLATTNFENAIRLAVSLGGDVDTVACMAGSISEAFYGMPSSMMTEIHNRLSVDLLKIVKEFCVFRIGGKK